MTTRRPIRLLLPLAALLLAALALAPWPGSPALDTTLAAAPPSPSVPADGTEPLPPGATIETVLPDMDHPTAMAFDPQGRLFYTEKVTGKVRLFANGTLQSNAVITF